MPTTLTLKNIPDAVYQRLKQAAEQHRRSLNSEAIVCLEEALLGQSPSVAERLARARRLRAELAADTFPAEELDQFRRAGRQ
jgi:antitoxin FitA